MSLGGTIVANVAKGAERKAALGGAKGEAGKVLSGADYSRLLNTGLDEKPVLGGASKRLEDATYREACLAGQKEGAFGAYHNPLAAGTETRSTAQAVRNVVTVQATKAAFTQSTTSLSTSTPEAVEPEKPQGFWGKVGGFFKGMSDSLGLTDLGVGLYKLSTVQFQVLHGLGKAVVDIARGKKLDEVWGDLQNTADGVASSFTQGLRAIKGGAVLLWNVVGGQDLWDMGKQAVLAVGCLAKGDLQGAAIHGGMAAMHGAFAAMSIAAVAGTVASGGAGAPAILGVQGLKTLLRTSFTTLAKEGMERMAQKAGTEIAQQLTEKLAEKGAQRVLNQSVEAAAEKAAAAVGEKLAQNATREAVLQTAKTASKEACEKATETVMKKLGAEDVVAENVKALLKTAESRGATEKVLRELGVSGEQAFKMSKDIVKATRSGKFESEIDEILVKEITAAVHEKVGKQIVSKFEAAFEKRLSNKIEAGFRQEIKTAAKEGAEEGTHAAIEKAVRNGVKKAREKDQDDDRSAGDRLKFDTTPTRLGGDEALLRSADYTSRQLDPEAGRRQHGRKIEEDRRPDENVVPQTAAVKTEEGPKRSITLANGRVIWN